MHDFLRMMDFSDNQFGGALYSNYSIYSKSTNPTSVIEFRKKSINQKHPFCDKLTMEKNYLTGEIPAIIKNLRMLQKLD
jgi:hypothetical protein